MPLFNDGDTYTANLLSLTEAQYQANLPTTKHYADKNAMQADLRGQTLTNNTEIKVIPHSTQNGVSATSLIRKGTILGIYEGTVGQPQTATESSIAKRLASPAITIVGQIGTNRTLAATMNHAFSASTIDESYVFTNSASKAQVCAANVRTTSLQFTISKNGQQQTTTGEIFVADRDIPIGEPLLWPYNKQLSKQPSSHSYFQTRGMTPQLFDKRSRFIDAKDYFPTIFYCLADLKIFSIPCELVPQLRTNPHTRTTIRSFLQSSPFVNDASIRLMCQRNATKNQYYRIGLVFTGALSLIAAIAFKHQDIKLPIALTINALIGLTCFILNENINGSTVAEQPMFRR